jgi:hypothetical protein
MMRRSLLLGCALGLAGMTAAAQEPTVKVETPDLRGSRQLEPQTATSIVRDYVQSWQLLRTAFAQNQASLLAQDFVGTALDKLTETITEQAKLGLTTQYQDHSHDLQVVFYSPEGGSIEMTDQVQYDEQVLDNGKVLSSQPMQATYLIVLTPAENRWMVRIFQAEPPK